MVGNVWRVIQHLPVPVGSVCHPSFRLPIRCRNSGRPPSLAEGRSRSGNNPRRHAFAATPGQTGALVQAPAAALGTTACFANGRRSGCCTCTGHSRVCQKGAPESRRRRCRCLLRRHAREASECGGPSPAVCGPPFEWTPCAHPLPASTRQWLRRSAGG